VMVGSASCVLLLELLSGCGALQLQPHVIGRPTLRRVSAAACSPGAEDACDAETAWCTTVSGLKYFDDIVGRGALPGVSQVIKLAYEGELTSDGSKVEIFGAKSPATLVLGNNEFSIYDELIDGMRVGGKRRVVIPPSARVNIAWGKGQPDDDQESIRFELELVAIEEGLGAVVPTIQARFRNLARKIGISPAQLFILLTFLPYLLPEDIRPLLWKSDGGSLSDLADWASAQSTGPEAQLDATLFDASIKQLDKSLYR